MAPRKAAADPTATDQQLASEASVHGISSEDVQRAAEKRRAAASAAPDQDAGMVAALLNERRGYVQRGWEHRVAQVDAELARYGHVVEAEE